jgi:hypothetical protein
MSVLLSFVASSLPECGRSFNKIGHVGAVDLTAQGDNIRHTVQVCRIRTGLRPHCNSVRLLLNSACMTVMCTIRLTQPDAFCESGTIGHARPIAR